LRAHSWKDNRGDHRGNDGDNDTAGATDACVPVARVAIACELGYQRAGWHKNAAHAGGRGGAGRNPRGGCCSRGAAGLRAACAASSQGDSPLRFARPFALAYGAERKDTESPAILTSYPSSFSSLS